MPAFHFDRRRLRRTARATLMAWLFALTAGVVNACVLVPVEPVEHAVGKVSVAHHGHGHEDDSGKASCLKFCDDESSAIAKVKLPVVDLGSSLLTVVEPWNSIAAADRLGFRHSLEPTGSRGPPLVSELVIRFLRLTL
jgi:hypothetical protein